MNTHESYVSLETAKMLNDVGFNWYNNDHKLKMDPDGWCYPYITLAVAQRWLREVKEMYAEAYLSESHHTAVWVAQVYKWVDRPLGRELRDTCLCTGLGPVYFDTYEQALEAGIQKCLTILLQK